MTRSAGTLAGSNAQAFLGTIHTAIVAHAAWEHVETITDSPAAGDEIRVYKCLGTENTHGADFFIAFLFDASAGSDRLFVTIAEGYNAATNEISDHVPWATVNIPVDADATFATSGAQTNPDAITDIFYTFSTFYIQTAAATFDYNISVTADRVIVATSVTGNNSGVYLGAYEDFVQVANNVPICAINLTSTGNAQGSAANRQSQGGYTRHPGRESQSGSGYHFNAGGGSQTGAMWTYTPKNATLADSAKDLFLGGAVASRIMASGAAAGTTSASPVYGFLRGLLYDVLCINAEATVVVNDTFTFGATVYDVICRYQASSSDVILLPDGV